MNSVFGRSLNGLCAILCLLAGQVFAAAPTITSITPTLRPASSIIVITGTGFLPGTSANTVNLTYNSGSSTANVWAATPTELLVGVPTAYTTGPITVSNANGSVTSSASFRQAVRSTSTITSFTPTSGPPGTVVTINGTNFGTTAADNLLYFTGTAQAAITSQTATKLVAIVPEGAQTGTISNIGPSGSAASSASFTVTAGGIAPTITSLSSSSGLVGSTLIINGTNFDPTLANNQVAINGVACTLLLTTSTQIALTVPASAATGVFVVTTAGGSATSGTFTIPIVPTILSFSPTSAWAGSSVVVNGVNFDAVATNDHVTINGLAATVTAASANQFTVTVPYGASTGPIAITAPLGTSTSGTNLTVTSPPGPTITNIIPTIGSTGSVVTILGTGFLPGLTANTINFTYNSGVVQTTAIAVTPTTLFVGVPTSFTTGPITVTNANGTATSSDFRRPVIPSTSTITSFTPTSGPVGTVVTVNGTNFGTSSVDNQFFFTGTTLTPAVITSATATKLTVTVPTGATTGKLSNIGVSGSATSTASFTVTGTAPAPTISSLSATSGPIGTTVVINGTNFDPASANEQVTINGVACPVAVATATRLAITVPAAATTGPFVVTTAGGSATSGTFTIILPTVTTISNFSPSSGLVGSSVTINGYNFDPIAANNSVTIHGVAMAVTAASATQLTVTVPTGAITSTITVSNTSGVATTTTNFTVTVPPPPVITSFTPTLNGSGSPVVITGTGFIPTLSGNSVAFTFNSGVATASVYAASATSLTVSAPPEFTTGPITVTNVNGTATSSTDYRLAAIPSTAAITSFSPTSGAIGSTVTITGTNFGPTVNDNFVYLNGTLAAITAASTTSLTVTVPYGASTGKFQTISPKGSATSSATYTITAPLAPPANISISPSPGVIDNSITISGTNFDPRPTYNTVAFTRAGGGTYSGLITSVQTIAPGQMQMLVVVPTQAVSGNVTISTTVGGSTTYPSYPIVLPPAPQITGFTPASGVVGTSVVLSGNNFDPQLYDNTVSLNGLGLPVTTVNVATSPNQLTVYIPGNATSGTFVLNTPGGSSTSAGTFTVVQPAVPTIAGFTPCAASAGDSIQIAGTNFDTNTVNDAVAISGTPFAVSYASATALQVTVPNNAPSGPFTVSNTLGSATSSGSFTFLAAGQATTLHAPAGNGAPFDPTSGPVGTLVNISGTNFSGTPLVQFTGSSNNGQGSTWVAATVQSVTPTQIAVRVPAGATTGPIFVTQGCQKPLNANYSFYVTASDATTPTINYISPTSGPVSTVVTIHGSGFDPIAANNKVTLNQLVLPVSNVTSDGTALTVTIPAGGSTGVFIVSVDSGAAASTTTFTVTGAPPTIINFTPTGGPVGTSVTINGTNFDPVVANDQLTLNSVAVPITTFVNTQQLIATIPATATTGHFKITTLGGSFTSTDVFTVGSITPVAPSNITFTPASGPAGTVVTISGANFDPIAANDMVSLNSIAVPVTSSSADGTILSVTIPAAAPQGAAPFVVHTGGGTGTSQASFIVTASPAGPLTPTAPSLATAPTEDLTSSTVGATSGQFSVDQGGNAQYRVPIYTPRGAGGLTPGLALTYSSGAGDSEFGIGWQLEGLSSISICRKTQEHGDGAGVSGLAETDPAKSVYCLDGQRLDLVSGTNGTDGAVYRLENDTFSKVVVQGANTANAKTTSAPGYMVPTAFAVYGKDGTVRHYGGANAQLQWQRSTDNAVFTKSWYQYDLQDTNSNVVHFTYNSTTSPAASMEISQISYVGGQINFAPASRGSYVPTGYQGGIPVFDPNWINGITVSNGSTLLRTYKLGYTALVSNPALQQITSVTECVGTSTCYAPTTFTPADTSAWSATAANPGQITTGADGAFFYAQPGSMRFGDINGDGRSDAVWIHNDGTSDHGSFHIGFSGGNTFASTVNTDTPCGGDNSSNPPSPSTVCPQQYKKLDYSKSFQLIDFDGDGRDDLMMLEPIQGLDNNPTDFRFVIWLSDGTTFKTKITNIVSTGTSLGPMPLTHDAGSNTHWGGLTLADLDGDGLPDAFVLNTGSATVWLLKPHTCASGETPCYRYMFQGPYKVAFGSPGAPLSCAVGDFTSQQLRVVDFNGDGRADLLLLQQNGPCFSPNDSTPHNDEHLQIFTSTGIHDATNFYFAPGYSWEHEDPNNGTCGSANTSCYADSTVFQIADFNGDGLPDVAFASYYAPGSSADPGAPAETPVYPKNPPTYVAEDPNSADGKDQQAGWVYQINTGDGGFGPLTCIDNCNNLPGPLEVQVGDYDGDGKADFLVPNWLGGTGCQNYSVYQWVGAPLGAQGFSTTPTCSPFWSPDIGSGSHDRFSYLVDLDGDGITDQLVINPTSDGGSLKLANGNWQVTRSKVHHQPRNVITQVTSGLGAVTHLTYAPLTYSSVYYREFNGYTLQSGWGSPVQDAFAPTYVVQYASSSAPTAASPTNQSWIRYQYGGMKVQGGGRGSLGFHKVYSTDLQTGIETATTYNQAYPLTGTSQRTTAYDLVSAGFDTVCDPSHNGNPDSTACMTLSVTPDVDASSEHLISDTIDTWSYIPALPTTGTPTPVFVYRSGSEQRKYDLGPGTQASETSSTRGGSLSASMSIHGASAPESGSGGTVVSTQDAPLSAQQSTFTYNTGDGSATAELVSYGELLGSVTTDYADVDASFDFTTPIRRVTTTQNYLHDNATNWYIGRLSDSTTVTEGFGVDNIQSQSPPITRKSSFEYDPTSGQLVAEHLQAGIAADQSVDKFHFHDSAGNETEVVTCSASATTALAGNGCSTSQSTGFLSSNNLPTFTPPANDPNWVQRYSRTVYDTSYVYPKVTYAPFSNGSGGAIEYATSTVIARDAFGNITDSINLQNVETITAYSVFGRQYFSATNTGGAALVTYRWCSANDPTAMCPSSLAAEYVVHTSSTDAAAGTTPATQRTPETWVYYDLLAREILRVQQGFGAGQYIAVQKNYDALGRTANVSEPYFTYAPSTINVGAVQLGMLYWTTTTHDGLGRVHTVTPPNQKPTVTTYSGLQTTVVLPANASGVAESKTKFQNHLGQIIEIDDNSSIATTLINNYDASGNVVAAYRGGADGKSATVQMTYDDLGRKKTLNDPDLVGVWNYTYNPVGEQLTQSSATTCAATQYDGQGRAISKSDYFNGTCTGTKDVYASWSYDTAANGVGQLASSSSTDNGIATTRNMYYDGFGRSNRVDTGIAGNMHTNRSTYDNYGRVYQTFFSTPTFAETGELYGYTAQGYAYLTRDAENGAVGQVYRQITAMDARGNVTTEMRAGNAALTTTRAYDPAMGWLTGIATPNVQALTYTYDDLGNLSGRSDTSPGGAAITETFGYDALQRLVAQTGGGAPAYAYDSFGNPTGTGIGYGAKGTNCTATTDVVPGPDAISTNVVAGSTLQYCYDARGNQTRILNGAATQQTMAYTADDKLRQVQTQNAYSTHASVFGYGAERERVARLDYANSAGTGTPVTTYYVGNAEVINPGVGAATLKRYLPGLILSISGGVTTYEYLFTDSLGSTHRITDQTGTVQPNGSDSFTPFGQRADTAAGAPLPLAGAYSFSDVLTHHGFTGQEQLDESGLIHMNGRIYSPLTMRFTSPDPFVQDPSNMQSYNRYSYVMNNPLTHTDPTGYWGHKQQGFLRTAAAIAISAITSGAASEAGWAAIDAGASDGGVLAAEGSVVVAGGAAAGFVQTGNLKGAVLGGVEAGIDFGIGQTLPFDGADANPGGNIAAHAVSGGVLEVLRGGKFGHGFVTAGLQAGIDPHLPSDAVSGGIAASIVGGSISQVTGGKFANGALSAAFEFSFNQCLSGGCGSGKGLLPDWLNYLLGNPPAAASEGNSDLTKFAQKSYQEEWDAEVRSAPRQVKDAGYLILTAAALSVIPEVEEAGYFAEAVASEMGILRSASMGKGNFGLGSASLSTSEALGRAWVGDGYTVRSDGKTLLSADLLRQFRPATPKPNSPYADAATGIQANFEQRSQPAGQWHSNGHLDIYQ